jgi:hypothetical protein
MPSHYQLIMSNITHFSASSLINTISKCLTWNGEGNCLFLWFQGTAVQFRAYIPWLATSAVDVAPMNELRTDQTNIQHTVLCVLFYRPFSGQFAGNTNAWSVKKTPKLRIIFSANYVGKSISKLQMDIELKQIRVWFEKYYYFST